MIVIYSEKPFLSSSLASYAREYYKNEEVYFIHSLMFLNFRTKYPHHLKWKDFPTVLQPDIQLAPLVDFKPKRLDEKGQLYPFTLSLEDLKKARDIVYAGDPHQAYYFKIFLEQIQEKRSMSSVKFNSFLKLKDVFYQQEPFNSNFSHMIKRGEVKKYFDYNFNLNSLAIFGKLLKHLGIDNTQHNISKYSLQVLYYLSAQKEKILVGDMLYKMSHWTGTKKYQTPMHLGTATSRGTILENLKNANLIEYEPEKVAISSTGLKFLTLLHKDCKDLDLPFRLDNWCESGLVISKPRIDKYLNTFFGKQKNKMDT